MVLAAPTDLDALGRLLPFRVDGTERQLLFVAPPVDLDFARPFWHMTMEHLETLETREELEKVAVSFQRLRELVGDVQPRPRA